MQTLLEKPMADSRRPMGRPKLGVIATTLRLPATLLARIDALMGANRRAQFIREAVERELERRERER